MLGMMCTLLVGIACIIWLHSLRLWVMKKTAADLT